MTQHVRVQDLVGRRVRDAEGNVVGRIESIHATWRGEDCLVDEYHLGAAALLARLGIGHKREPLRVPWQDMDLSDPRRPKLR
jgi:sporulation protein YlmC with PRC-barrel domain